MKKLFFHIVIFTLIQHSINSQCNDLEFSVKPSNCQDEIIDIDLLETSDDSLVWDFCTGEISNIPYYGNTTNYPSLDIPVGIHRSDTLLFVCSRASNEIHIYTFDQSYTNINSPGLVINDPLLDGPEWIELRKEGNKLQGFILNYEGENLLKISISSLQPLNYSIEDLGDLNGALSRPRGLEMVQDMNKKLLFVTDEKNNSVIRVPLSDDWSSNLVLSELDVILNDGGINKPLGLDIINFCGIWHGVLSSHGNNKLYKLNFGPSLFNNPDTTKFNVNVESPVDFKIVADGETFYAIGTGRPGNLYRLELDNDLSHLTGFSDFGDLSGTLGDAFGFEMFKVQSKWVSLSMNFSTNALSSIIFEMTECPANIDISYSYRPGEIFYSQSGSYQIGLQSYNDGILTSVKSNQINISNDIAPSISYISDNECISTPSSFSSSTDGSGLTYSWDFDEDGIEDSNAQNPSYTFPAPGTYNVRLDVDDGTCHNFTEQEITLYEEPPMPDFSVNGILCATGELTFTNETADGAYAGPVSYEWNFNGEATATSRDATYTFGSSGTKTITLKSSIPGCENTMQQVIHLAPGPTSNFSATTGSCTGELLSFTNTSTGADTYHWDFGDGTTSTNTDASHIYTTTGNYTVTLSATDTEGCTALHTQEVAIAPVPTANFSYDLPCTGGAGIAFFDESTVSGADILAWQWTLEGEPFSSQQNPLLSFDETGTYTVGLAVTSSNGCVAQYQEAITVQGAPEPAYSTSTACEGLATTFTDTTPGSNIVSRLWNIDGQSYTGATAAHVFTAPGTYDVSLTVTADNFCAATVSSQITVADGPSVDYRMSSTCAGDDIVLTDTSIPGADAITSRQWLLDGEEFFNGPEAILSGVAPGTHDITMQAVTAAGCTYTVSRSVAIDPSPEAAFEPSVTYGVPPYSVTFTNQSTGATAYRWRINGTEVSTSENFTQTITETGNQWVELVAINAEGCTDTTALTLLSEEPAIDLQVVDASLTDSGSGQAVSLEVRNAGNLPVEIFDVRVTAGDEFSISERFSRLIGMNKSTSVSLSSALQLQDADVVCLSVTSAYEDIAPDNNEVCISFTGQMRVEPPYPNPASDEVTVRVVLPSAGDVEVQVSGIDGHTLVREQLQDLEAGLHFLRYDFSGYRKGMYFITIRQGGDTQTMRVIRE